MFQFVGNVLRTVWGEDEDDDDVVDRQLRPDSSAAVAADDTPQTGAVTPTPVGNTWTFTGHVTSIHSDYGLVDYVVYFPFKLCQNFPIPKVGTKVDVTAERKHGDSGWFAQSLVAVQTGKDDETWDDVTDTPISTSIKAISATGDAQETSQVELDDMVAVVTDVLKNQVLLNENMTFDLSCVTSDYMPCKGDWVTCSTRLEAASGEREVLSIDPLRVWDFEGEVSSLTTNFGYLQCGNSEVYFSSGTCRDGYKPQRRDRVQGRAIECSRGRCPWRAIHIVPVKAIKPVPKFFRMTHRHGSFSTDPMCHPEELSLETNIRKNLSNTAIYKPVPRSPTQSVTSTLLENKGQMKITPCLKFGEMDIGSADTIKAFVRNEASQTQTLMKCRFCNQESQFEVVKFAFIPPNKEMDPTIAVIIPPGKVLVIHLSCTARYLGEDQKLLVFEFKTFKIGRYVSVNVRDTSYQNVLDPSAPYQRLPAIDRYMTSRQPGAGDRWLVPGQRPSRSMQAIKLPNRLPQFPVPPYLADCYLDHPSLMATVPMLSEELCLRNYSERFSTLLHLEEIQEEINIRQYDLQRVCLRKVGEFLGLAVPGLAEGRPSVLVGDTVIMTSPGLCDNEPNYQGYVHEVLNTEVLLKFHADFHNKYNGEDYNVRFTLNRTPVRRCHQAVKFVTSMGSDVLFPTKLIPKVPQTKKGQRANTLGMTGDVVPSPAKAIGVRRGPPKRQKSLTQQHEFFNPCLNARQKAAVLRILSGQSRPTPYVLFGPPGTGKTVTVVEGLLQVITHIPASRIIACTPSNSAADLLCQRLHMSMKIKSSEMVRLNSYSRSEESAPEMIRQYIKTGDDLEQVSRHRLLICTCSAAGQMYSLGLRAGHFTHIFIDEAGQATEPESMVAVGLVAGADGQVVLAGDPRQLGPVLQSRPALEYGLGMSFLERLIHLPLYERNEKKFADHGSYDPLMVTKLVQNYRSHGALLKLPSMLFYHNELLTSADPALINSLTAWDKLPNKNDFPLIFHGIRGEDLREGNSPSWFNPMEALQVMRYLQALNSIVDVQLTFDDIGIITPYRKQVEKIRLLIDKLGMDKVKVGSVEEFQGQERLVMIISTVRSNESHLTSDVRHNLGFLSNPKRFNVAISRAQALMVVIGNPHVLGQDENWKILIKYCVENDAYVGCDLPDFMLTHDHDVNSCSRSSTPSEITNETSALEVKEVKLTMERDGEAEHVDTDVSESDGDNALCMRSTDTEINDTPTSTTQSDPDDVKPLNPAYIQKSELDSEEVSKNTPRPVQETQMVTANRPRSATESNDPEYTHRPMQALVEVLANIHGLAQNPDGVWENTHNLVQEHESVLANTHILVQDPKDVSENPQRSIQEPSETEVLEYPHLSANEPEDIPEKTVAVGDSKNLQLPLQEPNEVAEMVYNSTQQTGGLPENINMRAQEHLENIQKPIQEPTRIQENLPEYDCGDCGGTAQLDSSVQQKTLEHNKLVHSPKTDDTCSPPEREKRRRVSKVRKNTAERLILSLDKSQNSASSSPNSYSSNGTESVSDTSIVNDSLEENVIVMDSDDLVNKPSDGAKNGQVLILDDNIAADVNGNTAGVLTSHLPHASQSGAGDVVNSCMVIMNNGASHAPAEFDREIIRQIELSGVASPSGTSNNFSSCTVTKGNGASHAPTEHDKIIRQVEVSAVASRSGTGNNFSSPTVTTDNSASHAPTELDKKIIRQIEYYFSDLNMSKDTFMQNQVVQDSGWVQLDVLITFKRLASLTTDFDVITAAMYKSVSGLLEVDGKLYRLRRSQEQPLPDDWNRWKAGLKDRSTFVIGLKTETQETELREYFEGWGDIEHIQKLEPQKKQKNDGVFFTYPFVVIFKYPLDARRLASNQRGIPYGISQLYIHFREDVLDMLYKQPKKKRYRQEKSQPKPATDRQWHDATRRPLQHLEHQGRRTQMTTDGSTDSHHGAGLLSTPDGLKQLPQPQRTQRLRGRGRGGIWLPPNHEPGVGAKSAPITPPTGWSGVARGRAGYNKRVVLETGYNVIGSSSTGSTRQVPNKSAGTGNKANSACHLKQGETATESTAAGCVNSASESTGAGFVSRSVSDTMDDSLEQDDSDVIIESSEEEILEN